MAQALRSSGYDLVGPVVRDGAVVSDHIQSFDQLPAGWRDEHAPGKYRLHPRNDQAIFGFVSGPGSWKRWFFPPEERLVQVTLKDQRLHTDAAPAAEPRYALIGLRACDLEAMSILDRVLSSAHCSDPVYRRRRSAAFLVAVQCTDATSACFCASAGSGPFATRGFDLALTELLNGSHRFLVEAGSAKGEEILGQVPTREATSADLECAREATARAVNQIRSIDLEGIREALYAGYEHPRWQHVAARCLACANCTMVCPTCFCSTVEDSSDLTGTTAERWRRTDSCFTRSFSYIHGGSIRTSVAARYRQWLTHKLAYWQDQFGTLGCVGCGRCITWCPAGIDITEEAAALRKPAQA
jgi:ferredoxin